MKTLLIKHVMDSEPRRLTLDEAFVEALQLSEGRSNEIEDQEYTLLCYLKQYPEFISHIHDNYKRTVIKAWDYEIIN